MPSARNFQTLFFVLLLSACASGTAPDLSGMSFSEEPLHGKAIWHDLVTEDIDAAKTFYRGLFGWELETNREVNGREYALAQVGDVYVAGLLEAGLHPSGENISRWIPYISVADVDATVVRTTGAGGEVVAAPRDVPLGRVAAITDSEGAVLGIAASAFGDPDDATTGASSGTVVWNELLAEDDMAAARFYASVFGYEASEIDRRGGRYILLNASGTQRAGILEKPVPEWKPVWLTYFGVADPAASAALAEKLGGKIVAPVSDELRDGTMAIIEDPSGAIFVLQATAF